MPFVVFFRRHGDNLVAVRGVRVRRRCRRSCQWLVLDVEELRERRDLSRTARQLRISS